MLLKDKELGQILNKFKTCAPIFIALGDEARQKLIMDIADAGNEGINVTHLSEKSHLSRPAISHHLKVLKDSGLIIPFKVGTQIFYKLMLKENLKEVEELINSIREVLGRIDQATAEQAAANKN